jgi:hypothetical protein
VLDLYGDEKHRHLADILIQNPKTQAGIIASLSTWMLGYPDRALRLENEKDAHARRRGHPFDLGFALMTGAHARGPAQASPRLSGWAGRIACRCCGQ